MNDVELLENPLMAILIIVVGVAVMTLLAYVSEKALLSAKAEGAVSFDPVEDPKDAVIRQLREELEKKTADLNDADYQLWSASHRINSLLRMETELRKQIEAINASHAGERARFHAAVEQSRLRGRALRYEVDQLRKQLETARAIESVKEWAAKTRPTLPPAPQLPAPLPPATPRRANVNLLLTLAQLSPELKRKLGL